MLDRFSAPQTVANRANDRRVQAIAALRRLRMTGPEIAEALGMPISTVSGILTRNGLGRLGRVGLEPAGRYECARPGELVHIDVKKLGRIQGGAGKRVRGDGRHYTLTFTGRMAVHLQPSPPTCGHRPPDTHPTAEQPARDLCLALHR